MTNRSLCCGAGAFIGGDSTTHYFVCGYCFEACDVYDTGTETGRNIDHLLRDADHFDSIAELFTTPSAIQCAQDQAKLLRDTARELAGK